MAEILKALQVDRNWTLFLDRDGVINEKLDNDYVKYREEFRFIEGSVEAVVRAKEWFGRIVVVTNQQGIGKGIMTHEDLKMVHDCMMEGITAKGGQIDAIYYCPELAAHNAACRKPNIGMAEQAQGDFPEIDFTKSIMVGDSDSDIEMGKRCGMQTVLIRENSNEVAADYRINKLIELFE